MQLGFNTNFRHRGVLFHIQTEDSGLENPHVITHLFHGGNIVASEKRDYSDKLGSADPEREVRILMEAQHRAMLRQLTTGALDEAIRQRLGADVFGDATDTAAQAVEVGTDVTSPEGPAEGAPPTAPTAVEGLPAAAPPGAPPPGEAPLPPAAGALPPPGGGPPRRLGDGVLSQKPLDEVVLDFLVENARKRKKRAKEPEG